MCISSFNSTDLRLAQIPTNLQVCAGWRQSQLWVQEEFLSPLDIGQRGLRSRGSANQRKNCALGVRQTWVSIWLHLLISVCPAESLLISLSLSFSTWETLKTSFPVHLSEAV